jgi:D-tyrosyl-tRNA(Tyr) deacylase
MIGLIQRVIRASVVVEGVEVGAIGNGLLVLLCAERGDSLREADLLLAKLRSYRVFGDAGAAIHARGRYALGYTAIIHACRGTG